MKYFMLLFFVMACGKSFEKEVSPLPSNQASPLEASLLNEALDRIQNDFDQLDVKINLRSIPYTVSDLNRYHGICFMGANGVPKGIALHHRIFSRFVNLQNDYGLLYYVLLHEIGHCFFNRRHEEVIYHYEGHQFVLNFASFESPLTMPFLYVTVMKDKSPYQEMIPKELWPYYVKEIAGLDRMETWEDLKTYTDIEITPVKYDSARGLR
jgi:hypothetical protein